MAQQGFGVSFLPSGDQRYTRTGQAETNPVQEAVKILSLRVPRVVGATPMAPLALLSGQGGGGLPSGVVETLLRALTPPEPSVPPVAAVPGPTLPAGPTPAPTLPTAVPQPTVPVSPGIAPVAQPTTPAAPAPTARLSSLLQGPAVNRPPAVMPTLTGAQGGMPNEATSQPASLASIPIPHITPQVGPATEPAATLPGTPTEPVLPERPGGQAETEALIDVARRIRAAMTNQMV